MKLSYFLKLAQLINETVNIESNSLFRIAGTEEVYTLLYNEWLSNNPKENKNKPLKGWFFRKGDERIGEMEAAPWTYRHLLKKYAGKYSSTDDYNFNNYKPEEFIDSEILSKAKQYKHWKSFTRTLSPAFIEFFFDYRNSVIIEFDRDALKQIKNIKLSPISYEPYRGKPPQKNKGKNEIEYETEDESKPTDEMEERLWSYKTVNPQVSPKTIKRLFIVPGVLDDPIFNGKGYKDDGIINLLRKLRKKNINIPVYVIPKLPKEEYIKKLNVLFLKNLTKDPKAKLNY